MLKLKRAYEPAESSDGRRILVDRLWPRGMSKRRAAIDEWMKEVAPSTQLRRWFGHDPKKWAEFQRRYKRELRERGDLLRKIAALASRRRVTTTIVIGDLTSYRPAGWCTRRSVRMRATLGKFLRAASGTWSQRSVPGLPTQ
jgi:uncharacterized protein YeaO (DUF488 family)